MNGGLKHSVFVPPEPTRWVTIDVGEADMQQMIKSGFAPIEGLGVPIHGSFGKAL
jgi:hypothetical protein